jgi:phosphoesterase RecJ-like protein
MTTTATEANKTHIAAEIRRRQRFVIVSHTRPDGDAIGSSLAMAYALRELGKDGSRRQQGPAPAADAGVPRRHRDRGDE